MNFDLVVAGAGLTGAVIADQAARVHGMRVRVVERRHHIAGNAFDEHDEHGVLVHRYGPHVFHTNSPRIWDYLSRFTRWRPYEHRVEADVAGLRLPVPFNLPGLLRLYGPTRAGRIREALLASFPLGAEVPILQLKQHPSPLIRSLADDVYEHIFLGYTTKQWGLPPEALDASVTARVPVRIGDDDRYFTDRYQALPAQGYASMVRRMLDHPAVTVELGVDFHELALPPTQRVVYTGPMDRYFDQVHGPLPYRSLRFSFEHHPGAIRQATGSVNYPGDAPYTRRCEFRILTGQAHAGTTIATEFPQPYEPGLNEPYYPIPRDDHRQRHAQYEALAARQTRVIFCGRLAEYRYLNMDQAVARALHVAETRLA